MGTRAHVLRGITAATASLCVSAAGAAVAAESAAAARLKLHVPAHVKKGKAYAITIDGSYKKRELAGRAFLVSLIQFAARPCHTTAQEENIWAIRTGANIEFYFAPGDDPARGWVGAFETKSPFRRTDTLKAASTGTRHVCSYLYPKFVQAGSALDPIARADARYVVTRR